MSSVVRGFPTLISCWSRRLAWQTYFVSHMTLRRGFLGGENAFFYPWRHLPWLFQGTWCPFCSHGDRGLMHRWPSVSSCGRRGIAAGWRNSCLDAAWFFLFLTQVFLSPIYRVNIFFWLTRFFFNDGALIFFSVNEREIINEYKWEEWDKKGKELWNSSKGDGG